MSADRNKYPPVSFYFNVTFRGVDGVGTTGVDSQFQEVAGFSQELATEELPEGGENRFSYRLPKRGKFANLVLKRGVMVNSKLVTWIQDAIDNFIFTPATVEVTLLNEEGQPLVQWEFLKAIPVKWASGDLKATDNSLLVETLELSYLFFTKSYVT